MKNEIEKIASLEKELTSIKQKNADLNKELWQVRQFFIFKEKKSIEYIYHLGQLNSQACLKIGNFFRNFFDHYFFKNSKTMTAASPIQSLTYADWIKKYDTISEVEKNKILCHILTFDHKFKFSFIIISTDNDQLKLEKTISSIYKQLYKDWEVIIVNGSEAFKASSSILISQMKSDDKIQFLDAANVDKHLDWLDAIKFRISGNFSTIIEAGDTISDDALYAFAAALDLCPDAQALYCDEDVLDMAGERLSPFFKTDWDLHLFLGQNYVGGLCLIERDLFMSALGQLSSIKSVEALYFYALTSANREKIHHIPAPFFHRNSLNCDDNKLIWTRRSMDLVNLYNNTNSLNAISKSLSLNPLWIETHYSLPSPAPFVTIIIPTHNRPDLIATCLDGVLNKTNYENLEVIVVDHENDHPEVNKLFKKYMSDRRVTIMPYYGVFDHSLMNNKAAEIARGEILLFLNDDIEVIEPHWLEEIVSHCVQREIGVVGARLLYPNRKIQHAGIILGLGGVAGHGHVGLDADNLGYFGRLCLVSEVSALTGACMAMRRSLFEEVGGFSACALQRTFNDVDLCLKALAKGMVNILTPRATLIHHESATDGGDIKLKNYARLQREVSYMLENWGFMREDPHYNVNLSLETKSYELAFPPRRFKPWEIKK